MGIGGISSVQSLMSVGSISSARPAVFNTNSLSVNSLNPVSGVANDVESSHISREAEDSYNQETLNPLQRGETANFADVFEMQFQMGMNQADRLFGSESVFAN